MEQRQSVDILREIIRSKGIQHLRKGNLFVNAVEDMGGKKGDVRLLRYLVEVDGANALLDAGGKPQAARQAIYSQTVGRICDTSQISPEPAHKVCATFWRAVYNTEPPVAYEKEPTPVPKPEPAPQSELVREPPDEIYARALECDRKGNITEAVRLYRQASELGHAEAQCDFGCYLLNGEGVAKDSAQAVNWFRESAAQGYARAQNWLGVCYAKGNGVPQSNFEAVKWYRMAAEQKDPYAQNNLSIKYENGQGVPRDLEQAVAWCRKAAQQGYEEAKKRLPALEAKLAKEQERNSTPKRSISERILLTLGCACLISAAVHLIEWGTELYQDWQGWGVGTGWIIAFVLLFVPIACNQYRLWKQDPFLLFPDSGVLTHILIFIQFAAVLAILGVGLGSLAEIAEGRYVSGGQIAIFPIYHVWWIIWAIKSAKRYT